MMEIEMLLDGEAVTLFHDTSHQEEQNVIYVDERTKEWPSGIIPSSDLGWELVCKLCRPTPYQNPNEWCHGSLVYTCKLSLF
jgi:hypothetical protein